MTARRQGNGKDLIVGSIGRLKTRNSGKEQKTNMMGAGKDDIYEI
jgi:hypothetical protein